VAEEEAGEYEVEYLFGDAGTYEMHVEIDVNGVEQSGEFHLPIFSPDAAERPAYGWSSVWQREHGGQAGCQELRLEASGFHQYQN